MQGVVSLTGSASSSVPTITVTPTANHVNATIEFNINGGAFNAIASGATTVAGLASIRRDRAIPHAADKPWPSEPVVKSIPGVSFLSQWPGRLEPPLFRVESHSLGKNPFAARAEYSAGPACPFESTSLSRFAALGSPGSAFRCLP
jgi:hypothetical protein